MNTGSVATYFLDKNIKFDFFQGPNRTEPRANVPGNIVKYNKILTAICKDPKLGIIAGGYFIKNQKGKPDSIDVYIRMPLDYSASNYRSFMTQQCAAILPNPDDIRVEPRRDQHAQSRSFYISLNTFTLSRENNDGSAVEVIVRFTDSENVSVLLSRFDFYPARIAYSYSKQDSTGDGIILMDWYRTCGPMSEAVDHQLRAKYADKGITVAFEKPIVYQIQ